MAKNNITEEQAPQSYVFNIDGVEYDVLDSDLDALSQKHPNATTVASDINGDEYDVKASDYRLFLERNTPQLTTEDQVASPIEKADIEANEDYQGFSQIDFGTEPIKQRIANQQEHRDSMGFDGVGQTQPKLNLETGKMEREFIASTGEKFSDRASAKAASPRFADMTSSSKIIEANRELERLKSLVDKRANEVIKKHNEDSYKPKSFLGKLAVAATQADQALSGTNDISIALDSDPDLKALKAGIRAQEEKIEILNRQNNRENGQEAGFWKGVADTALDLKTYDFGYNDIRDAGAMLAANGSDEGKTESQLEAEELMMKALAGRDEAQELYGQNDSRLYRWGQMGGHMPAFMLDFGLTGGGFKAIGGLGKLGAKAAVKTIGKEAAAEIATQGVKSYIKNNRAKGFVKAAADWTIKALGTTADDLVSAAAMTNTIQAGKTAADVVDRKLGSVITNADGSYDFTNDKTWGDAAWQGEANSIIENFSEMFGTHLDPVVSLKNLNKVAETIGAKRLSSILTKADAGVMGGAIGKANEVFKNLGMGDYFGEVTEEYYGQVWRTMLDLDDAYAMVDGERTNLLKIGQFHGDIWGGMALSMGVMCI